MFFVSVTPDGPGVTPFLVVDQGYLNEQRQKPREPYIARPPTWADVVHGANPETRFLERDQYQSLLLEADRLLVGPLRRDSDRRLPTLFVTGAPGCGKSTLVRHVAATLVDRGDVLVADLGPNHGNLSINDLDSYVQCLADLSRSGPPVLLLMDDPFFANSDWHLLLERLARPTYSNIGVLGASPTYLYDAYARRIGGRQVVLNRFNLLPTTRQERVTFSQMYGIEDDSAVGDHEDLLVFAMETAAGESFDDIIARIWSTLNDGVEIAARARVEELRWTVSAFLLISYLHRRYVMCPESLLRNALQQLQSNAQADYISELGELTFNEGWHIFRVSWQTSSMRPFALIGTMHASVAERAWNRRPVKRVDVVEWLANVSVNTPECAAQLAEFILACQWDIDPHDRALARRVAELWRSETVSTAQVCALVKGIRSSRPAAMFFRNLLRDRLKWRDSESWLAAIELIKLARRGSEERIKLEEVDLPACLKRANLASGSMVAIESFGSRGSRVTRRAFIDTLCAGLKGELQWELDSVLLIWLLQNLEVSNLRSLMPKVYEWLERHPEEEHPRVALVEWYKNHVAAIRVEELMLILDEASQWVGWFPDSAAIPLAVLWLAYSMMRIGDPIPDGLVAEIFSWVQFLTDDTDLRKRFFSLVLQAGNNSTVTVVEVLEDTRTWLRDRPDETGVRRALFGLLRVAPGGLAGEVVAETRAWLRDHPDDIHVRVGLLGLLREIPGWLTSEVVAETRAWLRDHPDDDIVRVGLLGLLRVAPGWLTSEVVAETRAWLRDHPDDARVRTGLLGLLREVPESVAGEVVAETRAWLHDHPNDNNVRVGLLGLLREVPGNVAGEMVTETRAWLRDHPDDNNVRVGLLGLLRVAPGNVAGEMVTETRAWLSDHPNDASVRAGLLGLLREIPGGLAGEMVTETRAWLRDHPNDANVRVALLGLVRVGVGEMTGEVVAETRAWLRDHPDDTNVRVGLLGLLREVPGNVAGEMVTETRAWLRDHPSDTHVRTRLLSLARMGASREVAGEVVAETRAWLRDHPDDVKVRMALLGLVRMGEMTGEVVAETRAWLRDHPDDIHVRVQLLGLLREVPGNVAGEMVTETRAWLRDHPSDIHVRTRLLSLARVRASREVAGEVVAETRAWLRDHPNDVKVRAGLLGLLPEVPENVAGEVVAETRAWLGNHPDATQVRAGLLGVLREMPETVAGEVVAEARAWLHDHPNDTRVHAALDGQPESPDDHAFERASDAFEG